MSEPRHNWWPFATNIIRDYPARKATYQGHRIPREMERRQDVREYRAVREAVEMTSLQDQGETRLQVVRLTEWQRSDTLATAAERLHIGFRTARRYRWQFILLVGYRYGLISAEEYYQEIRADNPGSRRR